MSRDYWLLTAEWAVINRVWEATCIIDTNYYINYYYIYYPTSAHFYISAYNNRYRSSEILRGVTDPPKHDNISKRHTGLDKIILDSDVTWGSATMYDDNRYLIIIL